MPGRLLGLLDSGLKKLFKRAPTKTAYKIKVELKNGGVEIVFVYTLTEDTKT